MLSLFSHFIANFLLDRHTYIGEVFSLWDMLWSKYGYAFYFGKNPPHRKLVERVL